MLLIVLFLSVSQAMFSWQAEGSFLGDSSNKSASRAFFNGRIISISQQNSPLQEPSSGKNTPHSSLQYNLDNMTNKFLSWSPPIQPPAQSSPQPTALQRTPNIPPDLYAFLKGTPSPEGVVLQNQKYETPNEYARKRQQSMMGLIIFSSPASQPSVPQPTPHIAPAPKGPLFEGDGSPKEVAFQKELNEVSDENAKITLITLYVWDRALWGTLTKEQCMQFDKSPENIKLCPTPDVERQLKKCTTQRQLLISESYGKGSTCFQYLKNNNFETAFRKYPEITKKFHVLNSLERISHFRSYKARFSEFFPS